MDCQCQIVPCGHAELKKFQNYGRTYELMTAENSPEFHTAEMAEYNAIVGRINRALLAGHAPNNGDLMSQFRIIADKIRARN